MLHLRDIMTTDIVTVSPDLPVREAIEILLRHHVSGAPVVAGGHVLGVITSYDLLGVPTSDHGSETLADPPDAWTERDAAGVPAQWEIEVPLPGEFFRDPEVFGGAEVPAWVEGTDAPLDPEQEEVVVADVMSHAIHSLPPEASVAAAADCLRRLAVHRVLVMECGRLLGIVSSMDIAIAVAEERLVDATDEAAVPA